MAGRSMPFFYELYIPTVALQPPNKFGFRLIRVRSPLLTESHMISLPLVT